MNCHLGGGVGNDCKLHIKRGNSEKNQGGSDYIFKMQTAFGKLGYEVEMPLGEKVWPV